MRTYSSGSGRFHTPGPAQPPISPPPMKSVTNSKRLPFQVNRYGHDEGLRSSSVTLNVREPCTGLGEVSACRIPEGHSTRTRSEEHTSELQSPCNLVCRLLLEKKKTKLYIVLLERLYECEDR